MFARICIHLDKGPIVPPMSLGTHLSSTCLVYSSFVVDMQSIRRRNNPVSQLATVFLYTVWPAERLGHVLKLARPGLPFTVGHEFEASRHRNLARAAAIIDGRDMSVK